MVLIYRSTHLEGLFVLRKFVKVPLHYLIYHCSADKQARLVPSFERKRFCLKMVLTFFDVTRRTLTESYQNGGNSIRARFTLRCSFLVIIGLMLIPTSRYSSQGHDNDEASDIWSRMS